eukprot:g13039.t1
MGRYPSTPTQVGALLAHVRVTGGVLDACGSTIDAVSSVLKSHDLHVTTNDFNRGLAADTHLDAGSERFVEAYGEGAMQPDWVVTSPPYSKAFDILVQTLRLAKKSSRVCDIIRVLQVVPSSSVGLFTASVTDAVPIRSLQTVHLSAAGALPTPPGARHTRDGTYSVGSVRRIAGQPS